jgi:hypothetical protein
VAAFVCPLTLPYMRHGSISRARAIVCTCIIIRTKSVQFRSSPCPIGPATLIVSLHHFCIEFVVWYVPDLATRWVCVCAH